MSEPAPDVLSGNWSTPKSPVLEYAARETRAVGEQCRLGRAFRWLTRPRRIAVLMISIWVLSAADLAFTLQEADSLYFTEMNPIAARLLDSPAHALVLYKLTLLMTGTVILTFLWRHTVAELACWFLLASCFYVAVRWYAYYEGLWGFDSQVFHTPM
ncbi:MAG: DUF5658 family protein [Planctomycetota bacterium]